MRQPETRIVNELNNLKVSMKHTAFMQVVHN
jgi:hypothetical protein